jgi:PDZ domain-containing protein
MLQDDGPVRRRPRRRLLRAAIFGLLAALVGGTLYCYVDAGNYYVIAPGDAPVVSASVDCRPAGAGNFALPHGKKCVQLILPQDKVHAVDGSILMVDVEVGPATLSQYLLWKLDLLHTFQDGAIFVPKQQILGTTPESQLGCQDAQQMNDATSSAAVVALRRLGYTVVENDLGAQVDQVAPGTPAARAGVQCNDLVTEADGRTIRTDTDLVDAIHASSPGKPLTLTVQRDVKGTLTAVHLQGTLGSTPAEDGQPANPNRAFLGVVTQTRITYQYPFNVEINVGNIGGPSAGLALTLGMLDSLSQGTLTGGLEIAATGTIDVNGNVGDVGGVAQKTVAVRRAGAKVFFVPPQELDAARSEAGSMKVYAVSTLSQALADLQSLGGHIPAAGTPSTSATTAAG